MPTKRLFDEDSHLCGFNARVLAVRAHDTWVALDATAFYPEEGGQRADRGTLDGIPVLELQVDEGETIWHRLERDPGLRPGDAVRGAVDADLRRDHRQQHTGQHILSRAFVEILGAPTASFHMGEEISTIDLSDVPLDFDRVRDVEERAQSVVVGDVPVAVTASERPEGRPLRTVAIGDFDRQHCCGTHAKRTGEVGMVKILRWEKARGLTRVTFVCGDRALRSFQGLIASVDGAARLFSAGWPDLPRAAAAAVEQAQEGERRAREWRKRWAALEGERLAREAARLPDGTLWVAAWIESADAETLRTLANAAVGAAAPIIVVLAGPGEPGKRPWAVARSERLPAGRVFDAGARLREILGPLGGRGGGAAAFAQGSCPAEEPACRERLARIEP